MLKFMKPHSKGVTPERLQKQKELFSFSESCFHGFPSKPTALAWDPELKLISIGTANGVIRIYGSPGVEFYGNHDATECSVSKLCFLPGQAAVVALTDDNSLHLWKIQKTDSKEIFTKVKSASLEGKLKKISVIVPDAECKSLFIGTEGGNIYLLDLVSFTMTNDIIYQDVVMQNVPEDYKVNPGPVESIAPHPTEIHKILVGYQRGLIVLWDRKQPCAEQTYVSNQQLESLCWNAEATEFMSSHNDGSYVIWSTSESSEPKEGPTTVYGPFPCKPITKIDWFEGKGEPYIVFNGGMPRANYGDRNTVTVIHGEKHVTFNLSSKVVDFVLATNSKSDDLSLFILAEEEIIFIDLSDEEWLPYHNEYLSSLHSSAITCCHFVADIDSKLFDKIKEAGQSQNKNVSKKPWPITGGTAKFSLANTKDLLLTGHEDGTVRFWDASDLCLPMLYKLSTSSIFLSDDFGGEPPQDEDEDWPPFRKVGVFDPYSDDPRLGIKKLEMCPHTGHLVIAGTAGQVIICEVVSEKKEFVPTCVEVNLVADADGFVWKSHAKLDLQTESISFDAGLQPTVLVQFYPPASCTSLHLHSEWGLIAVGTAHGFSLFDYFTKKNLLAKSTLSASDLANAADEGPMSRRKSLKKSLRESFRRLRKGRSQRKPAKSRETPNVVKSKEEDAKALQDALPLRKKSVEHRSCALVSTSLEENGVFEPLAYDNQEISKEPSSLPFFYYITGGGGKIRSAQHFLNKKFGKQSGKDVYSSDEHVPFFYYVTPKNKLFRKYSSSNSDCSGKSSDTSKKVPFLYYVTPSFLKQPLTSLSRGSISSKSSSTNSRQSNPLPFFYYITPKINKNIVSAESVRKRLVKYKSAKLVKQSTQSLDSEDNSVPFFYYISPKYVKEQFKSQQNQKKRAKVVQQKPRDVSKAISLVSLRKAQSYDFATSHLYKVGEVPASPNLWQNCKAAVKKWMRFRETTQGYVHNVVYIEPLQDSNLKDISDRHPSINTFIDDTPVSMSPRVPSVDPTTAPPLFSTLQHSPFVARKFGSSDPIEPIKNFPSPSLTTHSSESNHSVKMFTKTKLTLEKPFASQPEEEAIVKPVERAIEARAQHADYIGSMVRCLHLTKCYIASTQLMSATLWAGTNAGAVYVYTIFIPPSDKRMEVALTVQLGKEIHLKHAAPVINIMILDGASNPFPQPMAVKKGVSPSPDNSGPHKVLISSEEQFKVFTLPQLKPYCKYKLTAHEGSRVRKIGSSSFGSVVDKQYKESCFMIVTNLGDISVFSLPGARRQVQAQCIKKEDINGINSVVFTKQGEVLYLVSSSEIARISLSAKHITSPNGTVFPLSDLKLKKEGNSLNPSASSLCSLKKADESKESADLSLLSGDITIDSIRDHITPAVEDLKLAEKTTASPSVAVSSSGSEMITRTESTVKQESHTTKSVTIVKTSTILAPLEEVASSSVQVIETAQSPDAPSDNGEEAPLEQSVHDQEKSNSRS